MSTHRVDIQHTYSHTHVHSYILIKLHISSFEIEIRFEAKTKKKTNQQRTTFLRNMTSMSISINLKLCYLHVFFLARMKFSWEKKSKLENLILDKYIAYNLCSVNIILYFEYFAWIFFFLDKQEKSNLFLNK